MAFESLDDFKSAVEGLEDEALRNDILEFHTSSVEREKNQGIKGRRAANAEAVEAKKAMGQYLDALKNLGYDPESQDLTVEDFIEDLRGKVDGKQGQSTELEKKLRSMERKLSETANKLAEKERREAELLDKANRSTIKNALMKELGDKIYGADFAIDSLIANGSVGLSEDGKPVWIDGDEEVGFEKGVETFLSSHQDIVKNSQRAGSGSAGKGANTSGYSLDRIKQMTPQEIAKLPDDEYKKVKETLKTV